MEKAISAAQANREFSKLLRQVREGHSYIVTSHGRPVAKITPAEETTTRQKESREAFFKRLASQPARNIGRWTRDELYEDD